jgi:hypothetical protein
MINTTGLTHPALDKITRITPNTLAALATRRSMGAVVMGAAGSVNLKV